MPVYKWSQTSANNASADATINWAEGQAPSSINDSARAMMSATAKYRDDISGAIATGGTSTAYTVASNQSFDTLANMSGQVIAFTPHTTNGATVTLNVDGLGAKPLRTAPSTELLAGVLIQGTPYVAVYNNTDAAFYLQSFYGNPYNIPLGGMLDFTGSFAPNSSFVFPYGQAVSRTTYSTYFSLVSTTYGAGDGSTTFNVPDIRGFVVAGKDDMGGTTAGRITSAASGINGATLGATGGSETHTLTEAELPSLVKNISASASTVTDAQKSTGNLIVSASAGTVAVPDSNKLQTAVVNVTVTGTVAFGSGSGHANVQPTIMLNKILRVL